MTAKIDHIGLYVEDLEGARDFFVRFFGAECHPMYHNPRTGLRTFFLSFGGMTRLELLSRPETQASVAVPYATGFEHLAVSVGSREQVDALTQRLRESGHEVASEPRVTGDGYYESVVLGPSGCRIEITE
ncbi:MAG: VOC family protein [Bacteroidaceae bacterium]|nr:VOC family protein [Bacteroidaceae bacterium]